MKKTITFCLAGLIAILSACRKDRKEPQPVVYHKDGDVETLFVNNPKGVNIVVLGDAYIKEDLAKGGPYDQLVNETINYLFTVAPFKQYKQNFNTYVVYAESREREAAIGFQPYTTRTKFGSFFNVNINSRSLTYGNADTARKYIEKAVPYWDAHIVIMLVNDQEYGGTGGGIAVVSATEQSKLVLVHEIGHTFAGLGDEYVEEEIAHLYSPEMVEYLPNIDITNDPFKTKWSYFSGIPQYSNLVGAYEGAYYRAKGYYKPERYSVMSDLNYLSFNAPSREAIVKRIHEIMGVPFDFNQFLKNDAGSIQPVLAPLQIRGAQLIKNDFINMEQRINQLRKKQVK